MRRRRVVHLIVALAASLVVTLPAAAQWSGTVRCVVDVAGAGYSDRQTHRWVLASTPPTVQGAMRIQSAKWSVAGQGSLHRSQGSQTLDAQWTTNVQGMDAPIAFTVRASDGRLVIKPAHAQLRMKGGVSGSQQLTVAGKPQKPAAIDREAFEWSFPSLESAATVASISGSKSTPITGSVGVMQPADARGTAACEWNLSRGAATP